MKKTMLISESCWLLSLQDEHCQRRPGNLVKLGCLVQLNQFLARCDHMAAHCFAVEIVLERQSCVINLLLPARSESGPKRAILISRLSTPDYFDIWPEFGFGYAGLVWVTVTALSVPVSGAQSAPTGCLLVTPGYSTCAHMID